MDLERLQRAAHRLQAPEHVTEHLRRRVGRDEELLRDTGQGAQIVGAVAELCRQTLRPSRTHRIDQPPVGITSCRIEVLHRERHTPILPANTHKRKTRWHFVDNSERGGNVTDGAAHSQHRTCITTGRNVPPHYDSRRIGITSPPAASTPSKMWTTTPCGGKNTLTAPREGLPRWRLLAPPPDSPPPPDLHGSCASIGTLADARTCTGPLDSCLPGKSVRGSGEAARRRRSA